MHDFGEVVRRFFKYREWYIVSLNVAKDIVSLITNVANLKHRHRRRLWKMSYKCRKKLWRHLYDFFRRLKNITILTISCSVNRIRNLLLINQESYIFVVHNSNKNIWTFFLRNGRSDSQSQMEDKVLGLLCSSKIISSIMIDCPLLGSVSLNQLN